MELQDYWRTVRRRWRLVLGTVLVVLPIVWGFLRKQQGLPMFGSPTIAEMEDPDYQPGLVGMKKVRE